MSNSTIVFIMSCSTYLCFDLHFQFQHFFLLQELEQKCIWVNINIQHMHLLFFFSLFMSLHKDFIS